MKRIALGIALLVCVCALVGCASGSGANASTKTFATSLSEGKQLWFQTASIEENSTFDLFVFENEKLTIYSIGATFADIKGMSEGEIIDHMVASSSGSVDLVGKSEEEINDLRVQADQFVSATQEYEITIVSNEAGDATEYEALSFSWLARYPGTIKMASSAAPTSFGGNVFAGYVTKDGSYFVQRTEGENVEYMLDSPNTSGVTVES